MVDRKLIASALTILMVLVSQFIWPPTTSPSPTSLTAAPGSSVAPDWSAVLRADRQPIARPSADALPAAFGPVQLPVSLVSLLRDGTNWEISGAADATTGPWKPLAASTVDVNEAEGYVLVQFVESSTPTVADGDVADVDGAGAVRGVAAATNKGLQSLACEEHGGSVASTSSGNSGAAAGRAGKRRVRSAGASKVTGRCFLTLDDPSDVMSEEVIISFAYEVVAPEVAAGDDQADEASPTGTPKGRRVGAAGAAAASRRKSAKAGAGMARGGASGNTDSAPTSKARVLEGAAGWLQLEQEVDVEAAAATTDVTPQRVGVLRVREGVLRSDDGTSGFKATIQLFFFPDTDGASVAAASSLFPAAVELSAVHGSFARAAQHREEMAKKASVTSFWARYVSPLVLVAGLYGVSRVLNAALTKWLDNQQKAQKPADTAEVGPDEAKPAAAPAGRVSGGSAAKPAVRA